MFAILIKGKVSGIETLLHTRYDTKEEVEARIERNSKMNTGTMWIERKAVEVTE